MTGLLARLSAKSGKQPSNDRLPLTFTADIILGGTEYVDIRQSALVQHICLGSC